MKHLNQVLAILFCLIIVTSACDKPNVASSRVDNLPYYSEATFTPHWYETHSDSLANFHRVSSFSLINQDGDTVDQHTFKDKIYITDFFFTACPGICPKMTTNMGLLQDEFFDDDEILLLSHSVTPEYDSVAVLNDYANAKGVLSSKWHLVTGDREEIYKLGREDYFAEEDLGLEKDPDDFLHTENFVLVDKRGYLRGIYNGLNKTSINQLIADVRALQKEKA